MPYYVESKPTPERRDEVRRLCDAKAAETARIVGMAAWYDQFHKVLTDDELAILDRSFEDKRNPGSVTMAEVFLEWMR